MHKRRGNRKYILRLKSKINKKYMKPRLNNHDLHELFHYYDLLDQFDYYENIDYYKGKLAEWRNELALEAASDL